MKSEGFHPGKDAAENGRKRGNIDETGCGNGRNSEKNR